MLESEAATTGTVRTDEHGEFLRIAKSGDVGAAVDCVDPPLQRVEDRLSFEPAAAERHLGLVKALLS